MGLLCIAGVSLSREATPHARIKNRAPFLRVHHRKHASSRTRTSQTSGPPLSRFRSQPRSRTRQWFEASLEEAVTTITRSPIARQPNGPFHIVRLREGSLRGSSAILRVHRSNCGTLVRARRRSQQQRAASTVVHSDPRLLLGRKLGPSERRSEKCQLFQ